MENLSIDELNSLRLTILRNAKSLIEEAEILFAHGMFSRSYLLAHFSIEELGKLPMIVGVVAQLTNNESIDWKRVMKRFRDHKEKIGSQNGHYYMFSIDNDLIGDSDLDWLNAANKEISETYMKKNISTYVDVVNGKVVSPLDKISKVDAAQISTFAQACLKAHEKSEGLINPLIYENTDC